MLSYAKRTIDPEPSGVEMEANVDSDDQSEKSAPMQRNAKKRKVNGSALSANKREKLEKNLYKQPTVEELNQLKETENLFHSNLFRLQIEEILNAVKIKPKYKKLFDTWFEKFKNHVNAIEGPEEFELQDDSLFDYCSIKIPMKKLPNHCSGTFKYERPASITTGGSYSLDTVVGPEASIDVFVEMPKSIFQEVDAKNYRYIRKKAIYLSYIASNVNEELAEEKTFVGNHSNPVLKIVPSGKLGKKFVIYIHVVVQETAFSMNKFTAEKNNVRPKWFFNKYDESKNPNPPTPHYNNVILYDLTALKTNAQNIKLIKEYPNIRDGIILLKIWLKQREFTNNFDSFNGHIITSYVLYLLFTKKLNTFMSSYQIVRNTWQHLANSNWCKEGISLCQDEKVKDRISQYHNYYDCVFIDSTGFHNLASNILPNIFEWISSQAKMSIDCLNNTRVNGFQILFMRKVPFNKAFDYIVCFHNVKAVENIVDAYSGDADKLDYGPKKHEQAIKLISKLLKQGLGNRVSHIGTMSRKIKEWKLSEEIPNDLERFYIGLKLDPDFSFNIIEKGPAANLPEAKEFRRFWGKKSELRRFKDGTICEAVVWAKENALISHKRHITQKIAKYLLGEKLKLFDKLHYFFFSNQVEEFLKLNGVKTEKFWHSLEESSLRAIKAFDELEKELSSLADLPLTISGVQGCGPVFRYADVFPPLPCRRPPDGRWVVPRADHLAFSEEGAAAEEAPLHLAPIEATVQLSTSGKWPDDLEALRMTKAAFHVQIAQCMRKQHGARAHGSLRHIDVLKDGYVFRLRIAHQKEIGLVKQMKDKDGVIKYRDNEESIELEKQLFHLPRLTGALYGLHCQQPSFGPACCLAKRWLSAQLIDDSHMPDIAVELLVASMYLSPDPYPPAQTPQVAFLRFLEALASEHWTTDPVIVNFNDEMTREEIVEVENAFGASRESLPALFISTPYDPLASAWTRRAPTPLILRRVAMLAGESLRLLDEQLASARDVGFGPLFAPPLTAYDCLIRLRDRLNPRRIEATGVGEAERRSLARPLRPFVERPGQKMPVVDFDPVAEYLKELRNVYSEFALFFHDTYGGSVIGVLLKPQALQEKDFKVTNTSCQMYNNNKKLVLNVSAMIEDFYILGKGLVETIDIQSKKLNPT